VSRVPPAAALATAVDDVVAVGRPGGEPLAAGRLTIDPHRLPGALALVGGRRTRRLVREADVLVAVDAAALPAVWWAARVNHGALAVNGLPAALARLG